MSGDDPYLYLGSSVLINRLGIKSGERLDYAERELVAQRIAEGAPSGDFDLAHLRAIHRHLFPGPLRLGGRSAHRRDRQGRPPVPISPLHRNRHGRRSPAACSSGFPARPEPCRVRRRAAPIIGDVNYVHPFREGNGRTQLQYLEQLAVQAGHPLDIVQIDPKRWLEASRSAHDGDYEPMRAAIGRALAGSW